MFEPISDAAVTALANAVFAKGNPMVVEAYSEFETEPRTFTSAASFCAYVAHQRRKPCGGAHFAIYYPDTGGRLTRKRITLNPSKRGGFKHRFAHEGWGIVWVYLHLVGVSPSGSFISANSQKRAEEWAAIYPELDPPATWIWPAVASHARRLSRVLKRRIQLR
ncbi:hypothetical protein, partial [Rhodanobacter thiooxydans]